MAVVDIGHLTDLRFVVGIVQLDVDDCEIEQIIAVVFDDVGELISITLLQTSGEQDREEKTLLY